MSARLEVGTTLPAVAFDVTRADLSEYADASGDPNPIHLDPEVARAVGLPDTIAHGMLTLALAARAVSDWTGDAEVVELGGRFTGMVVVPEEGTRVEFGGEVTAATDDTVTISLSATCAGAKVLGRPTAVVRA
jgi:acyl dehydratase